MEEVYKSDRKEDRDFAVKRALAVCYLTLLHKPSMRGSTTFEPMVDHLREYMGARSFGDVDFLRVFGRVLDFQPFFMFISLRDMDDLTISLFKAVRNNVKSFDLDDLAQFSSLFQNLKKDSRFLKEVNEMFKVIE